MLGLESANPLISHEESVVLGDHGSCTQWQSYSVILLLDFRTPFTVRKGPGTQPWTPYPPSEPFNFFSRVNSSHAQGFPLQLKVIKKIFFEV